MKELSKKEELFYNQWEMRRKNKWRYVLIQAILYWGLPFSVGMILISGKLTIEKFLISIVIFGIGGLFVVLRFYKQTDKKYLSIHDDDEIVRGLQELKKGGSWNYENLKIHSEAGDSLIIQNALFWFDDSEASQKKLDECYSIIKEDFKRLQKNKDFEFFTRNKKIKIQVIDNTGSSKLISGY